MNDADDLLENITYDELQVGQTARLLRTLGAADIAAFAAVSGDINPAHLDPDYAAHTPFHGVVAHGMWGAALISRVLGTVLPGPGTIYLAQTLQFLKPVRIGDELCVTVSVTAKAPARQEVQLDCSITNQEGAVVLTGLATVIAPAGKVRRPRAHVPPVRLTHGRAMHASLLAAAAPLAPVRCAVVHPCDGTALGAALDAAQHALIVPVLVGPLERMRGAAAAAGRTLDAVELIDAPHSHGAAAQAAALAAAGEVGLLMQGSLAGAELLDAVRSLPALTTERQMSHVFHAEVPLYDRPLLITDGVLHIRPSLAARADIVRNAVALAQALGRHRPRVAVLSALATVHPALPATVEAAALCKMAERGQLGSVLIDGPMPFDSAVSPAAAHLHDLSPAVAGHADILIVPDLEAGRQLVDQLVYLAGAALCGVAVGARVPVALHCHADGVAARIASLALARLAAGAATGPRSTVPPASHSPKPI